MNKAMLKYFKFGVLCLSLQSLALSLLYAGAPLKINYQGRLEESGEPVDGQRNFVFKIYNAASGGSLVWTSQAQDATVADGVFSVVLEAGTPVNLSAATFTGARYIEVSVGGVTLSPRQEMLSVPYALTAQALADDYVDSWTRTCVNPADANDIMVPVGDLCVDKYEASVWSTATGGTQYGSASDNYLCNDNGQDCGSGAANPIYARSVVNVAPSHSMTWFQAAVACKNAGKHLLTNAEWQVAAAGTPDPGSLAQDSGPQCNTNGTGPMQTGLGTSCRSSDDVENMIGSLWEWVADWGTAGAGVSGATGTQIEMDGTGTGYNDDTQWNIGGISYTSY
ncbi:MAG: hypothetical protein AAB359_05000, partial [Elusimicrobiota bacterium]